MPKTSSSLLKRRLEIAEIVRQRGEIKVDDLSAQLNVSGVTIRNDLNYLEQQGYLKRSFGGAIYTAPQVPVQQLSAPPPQIALQNKNVELELAQHCARLVNDRDTLFLGHGELTRKIIPLLAPLKKLRLIINDVSHVALADDFIDGEVILTGGVLNRSRSVLSGKMLEYALQQYTISLCVIEVASIDLMGELTIENSYLAPHYQHLLSKSQRKAVIAARPPLNSQQVYNVSNINSIDAIITCQHVINDYQQQFGDSGFINQYTNNECFTWINRLSCQE
ncbi:DeoR/GlpR family DNA-binding transcription regulator [Budvicia diplopodorum]|uniref:DeoR/GlpR family DNA-binding transcription regulator n=1 Tax=Budvicia diplopodorum TaxID=1119056 RepID=UPI00135B43B2|nr:DeoR/GlpR family DNA-binding transcription regulator [Budvicia diplopodorum]